MDTENRLVISKGEESCGGMEREFGSSKHKLLYTEWINNKVPCITQNYIQYPMMNHNIFKIYIYICICVYIYMYMCIYIYV